MSRLGIAASVLLAGASAGAVAGAVRTHEGARASDRELAQVLRLRDAARREETAQAVLRARLAATRGAERALRRRAAAGDRSVLVAIRAARRARPRVVVGAPRVVVVRGAR